jgi:aspartokinase/homoserine dehydrogenase 1
MTAQPIDGNALAKTIRAEVSGGRKATPAEALSFLAKHALANPILVDLTAHETTPLLTSALGFGMHVVLANKRPLSGPREQHDAIKATVAVGGQRMLTEATVGAGLPIFDTYQKLEESGDRVLKSEGCLAGTLGFVMTEVERGRSFSDALRRRWSSATPSPIRATICRARTSVARR